MTATAFFALAALIILTAVLVWAADARPAVAYAVVGFADRCGA